MLLGSYIYEGQSRSFQNFIVSLWYHNTHIYLIIFKLSSLRTHSCSTSPVIPWNNDENSVFLFSKVQLSRSIWCFLRFQNGYFRCPFRSCRTDRNRHTYSIYMFSFWKIDKYSNIVHCGLHLLHHISITHAWALKNFLFITLSVSLKLVYRCPKVGCSRRGLL